MRVHKLNNVEHAMGMLEKQKVPIILKCCLLLTFLIVS